MYFSRFKEHVECSGLAMFNSINCVYITFLVVLLVCQAPHLSCVRTNFHTLPELHPILRCAQCEGMLMLVALTYSIGLAGHAHGLEGEQCAADSDIQHCQNR